MSSPLTLFDLSSKPPNKSWSSNPWKTRLVLNYKSIPYTTHWLELPDIEPHLKSLSVPPNQPTAANPVPTPYTIPTIRLPSNGPYIVDTKAIACELEKQYPSPPLPFDTPQQKKIEGLWPKVLRVVVPAIITTVARNLLNERSVGYFIETRAKMFGVKVEDLKKEADDTTWEEVRPVLEEIGSVLREKGGPFVLGEEVSYADFILVGGMQFLRRTEERYYQGFVAADEAFGRLFEACRPWLEKDT